MEPTDPVGRYVNLREELSAIVGDAFDAAGFDRELGEVVASNRPDLCQFQCNGALTAAQVYRTNPFSIAEQVAAQLPRDGVFRAVGVVRPGFINLDVDDALLAGKVAALPVRAWSQAVPPRKRLSVIVDFGGANVAKPLHVGHLRAAIIGESVIRIARYAGHDALGDVHLGDWGLQMGMLIHELAQRRPELPYFDAQRTGGYPAEPPITVAELDELYPTAAAHANADPAFMEAARRATFELQSGRPGYAALWRSIVDVSIADLQADYAKLGVHFDLWLGESDAEAAIPDVLALAERSGLSRVDDGALIVDVEEPDDTAPVPPLLLRKGDGGFLYGTTDLATIVQRARSERAFDTFLYVVDNRQHTHFTQVFRAARKLGIVGEHVVLQHVGFGTMNGKDGKPFKTRAGGVMRLKDLIAMVTEKALERLNEAHIAENYDEAEKLEIARRVGVASLKFADFSNVRTRDYVFDLDRFSSFEGRTGPYLLYTAVRAKSILRRAAEAQYAPGTLLPAASPSERALYLELSRFGDALARAWDKRGPSEMCEFAYQLAVTFSNFYRDHHMLREPDPARRASYLGATALFLDTVTTALDLLGIDVPDRM